LLLVWTGVSGCGGDRTEAPGEAIDHRLARVVEVPMPVDLSRLPAKEKEMLRYVIEAGHFVHEAYLEQILPAGRTLRDSLASLEDERSAKLHKMFVRNGGPYDKLDHFFNFLGAPEKNPGSGFYPAGVTKADIEAFLGENPQKQRAFLSPYSVIVLGESGLNAVPFHEQYAEWLVPAAELLMKAAAVAEDSALRRYLTLRSAALLTDDYLESDLAWIEASGADYEVVFGPDEVYDDGLMGIKASYEVTVGLRDKEASEQLRKFSKSLPDIEQSLPYEAGNRGIFNDREFPMVVVRDIYRGGDISTGYQAAAANLPNDPRVHLQKGTKRIFWKNIIDARLEHIILPLGRELIASPQVKAITMEGLFNVMALHELCHGVGPRYAGESSDSISVNQALKEHYSAIEESKADIAGLHALSMLEKNGTVSSERMLDNYVTYLASLLRSIRFGTGEAHGLASLCELNYLHTQGGIAVNSSTGKWSVDISRIRPAVTALAGELLAIEATGDYGKAAAFLTQWGTMPPALRRGLEKTAHLPVEIYPVYAIRWE
jgi:hypothetical protein